MFNENEIKAYQSFSAPANLRERVLSMQSIQEEHLSNGRSFFPTFRMVSRVTVSLAFAMLLLFVLKPNGFGSNVSISVAGDKLTSKHSVSFIPDGVTAVRHTDEQTETITTPSATVSITLKNLPNETHISVSEGEIALSNDSAEDNVLFGTNLTATGDITILWQLNPDDAIATAFVMTLEYPDNNGASKSETLTLVHNEATNDWVMTRCIRNP